MEVDEVFNRYICCISTVGHIRGCVRLLSSTGPTMLRDTFLRLLERQAAAAKQRIWKSGRFASLDVPPDAPKTSGGLAVATYELFAMIGFDLLLHLAEIVTDAWMAAFFAVRAGPSAQSGC
ncbi:acyl-homoserine-lactone synthase [Bradyrhizobium arachidis]|uniref:acyl-homoserine-lactone synthase n=1 Tax=Bradyrhizobium arachidis TaxID=858423 RepID=UPI002161920C|nr:acyl-homoserine-lactone synthase [Bradyrhizobium arachidis]